VYVVLHVVTTHETPHDTEGFRFFCFYRRTEATRCA
jgi:hypothetical protein